MPQATDELRAEWSERLPDGTLSIDDGPATAFLESQGYVLRHDWLWTAPTPYHVPTAREASAVTYLIEEWDYGGIAGPAARPSGIAAAFDPKATDGDRSLLA